MTSTFLQQHWALVSAGIVGAAVMIFVLWRTWLDSARGRLSAARRHLRDKCLAQERQRKALQRLSARLDDFEARAAENHVRKIIVEEFPPKRHDRMRGKYLPGEREDGKPFSF